MEGGIFVSAAAAAAACVHARFALASMWRRNASEEEEEEDNAASDSAGSSSAPLRQDGALASASIGNEASGWRRILPPPVSDCGIQIPRRGSCVAWRWWGGTASEKGCAPSAPSRKASGPPAGGTSAPAPSLPPCRGSGSSLAAPGGRTASAWAVRSSSS